MNDSVPKQDKIKPETKPLDSETSDNNTPVKLSQPQPNFSKDNAGYQPFNYNQFSTQEDTTGGFYGFFDYNQRSLDSPDYSSYFYQPNTYFSNFPRARDYNDDGSIVEAFPHLKGFNDPNFNIDSVESDDYFFIMRSSNDDNIHKAIKYHVWTSTASSNARLQEAWNDANNPSKSKPNKIYLIYSVVNSYQFMGVAELLCPPNKDVMFNYWWEPRKWYGTFDIKWIFIKDVPHKKFEHIKEESQTVTTCKDCTRLSAKSGKQILGIFKSSPNKPNIFEAFEYMDNRENILRLNRDRDPSFSDPAQREGGAGYRGGFQQKRQWKPHGQYKRTNDMNTRKFVSKPYYGDNTGADDGGYGAEDKFAQGYQYQNDRYNYQGTNSYGYSKGPELNTLGAPTISGSTGFGYSKGNTGGYQGGQMGAFNTGGASFNYYNQSAKGTGASHHGLRTDSHAFNVGTHEFKDFSEQFVIKKAGSGQKSAEKKKKPKKNASEDRVPNDFFDNKSAVPGNLKNVEESDEDQK